MLKRSMFGVYVKGSFEAVDFYQQAFGAKLLWGVKSEDGNSYIHAELDVFGQILAISEALPEAEERTAGNIMQFNLHFGEGSEEAVKKAYEILKDDAQIQLPLGEYSFVPSPLMFGLTDKFGVNWCLYITS